MAGDAVPAASPQAATLGTWFGERGLAQAELPSGGSVCLRFSTAVEEHLATRQGAGIFDFSFMGWWAFGGPRALDCLQQLQTRDLRWMQPGTICYTLICRDDGSVFVDATVWRVAADLFWLFTGRRSDAALIQRQACAHDMELAFMSDRHATIAVQGPSSARLVEQALNERVTDLPYFGFRQQRLDGQPIWIARLGYTGELGYELLVPSHHAVTLWSRLASTPFDGKRRECGMEAADGLRIEAGFIHFAHELAQPVWPAELGLERLVRSEPDGFIGQRALAQAAAASRRLKGVRIVPGLDCRARHARTFGPIRLTSEAHSPLFGCTLGLALVDRRHHAADTVRIEDGRGGELVDLPFRARQAPRP
ncbi:MAG: aminomethyltransferase family protein [Caldimonas sp.]